MSLKLKVIIGSTRPGRAGPKVADWVVKAAEAAGAFEVELVDLAEMALPLLDEPGHPRAQNYQHDHTKRWAAKMDEADAFIFVTPEYDGFPPAALVNAVQCLVVEWRYKPAGVVSYGGVSGGLRSAQELRQLVANVGMMALPEVVPVPFFSGFIDDSGTFTPNDKMAEGMTGQLSELARVAAALRPLHTPG